MYIDIRPVDIHQRTAIFKKEVVMAGHVCVEIGTSGIDHHFAQQASRRKLVQSIIDGRQRDLDPRSLGLLKQQFCGDVMIARLEQQPRKGKALTRRAQPHSSQPFHRVQRVREVYVCLHSPQYRHVGGICPLISRGQYAILLAVESLGQERCTTLSNIL